MFEKKPDPILDALNGAVAASEHSNKRCTLTFNNFFQQYPPAANYLYGPHTHAISAELQAATEAVERGECYYVIITVPPRHGKSDQCSRRYPPWHLCRNPDHEIILTTYSADLSEYMARAARKCFAEAAPRFGLRFSDDQNQVGAWSIEAHKGGMFSIGLGGTITGRGANILIVDDYCKNRAEAESETVRQGVWDSFRNDLMTRLAPAHAVIILATRWHEDDLVGRILEEMEREPTFPKFKLIKFPAQNEDGSYLFTERFPPSWYQAQRAAVGAYAWESLYQCNPQPRSGRLLRADLAQYIDADKLPPGLVPVRGWDLASTDKERIKDDPDYTVGTKVAFKDGNLYILDVVRGQWSAPKRDERIIETAKADGRGVHVKIEVVAGYKDTFTRVKSLLSGVAVVRSTCPSGQGDKVARASVLEPLFEAGKVFLVRAPWNAAWISEFLAFPKGKKDDQVDSTVVASSELIDVRRRMKISS